MRITEHRSLNTEHWPPNTEHWPPNTEHPSLITKLCRRDNGIDINMENEFENNELCTLVHIEIELSGEITN